MINVHVPFLDDLRAMAEDAARERGIPLDEFVRQCVSSKIKKLRTADSLFLDNEAYVGEAPADSAEEHDRYL